MSSGKIDIDFLVSSSPYFLSVTDMSYWGLIVGKPTVIEIGIPGQKKKIKKYFDQQMVNVYNSFGLGVNCNTSCGTAEKVTLEDGIYTIKVMGSPSTFSKEMKYLKTDLFDMELDKLFISLFSSPTSISTLSDVKRISLINKLSEISLLMRGAKAYLKFDNMSMTNALFEKAVDMVEDFKNCKSCN